MPKGGKMFDAIMISIIIIAALNYADYIKVDTKLMMVLLAIALYVTAKQTQKSNQKTQHSKKVEPLDGSTVAFDKEAFVNLNNIVNQLVKKDSVTIPGNLIVLGKTTFEADMNVKGITTIEKDLNVHTSVNVGTDDANAVRIRQNRIGTKACADMYFNPNGWLYHYPYGGEQYKPNCGYAASNLHAQTNTRIVGSLRVDGATELKGTLNAHGQVTCNNTSISGLTVGGNLTIGGVTTCNGQFRSEGEGVFRMPNGHYSHINASDGKCIIRGDVRLDGDGGSGTTVFATGFMNKDNEEEGMLFDQRSLRLQAMGSKLIALRPNWERNSVRSTAYDFEGTEKYNVDSWGNIYMRLSDGHGRWMRGDIWSNFHK